jgi:hypothetical protein
MIPINLPYSIKPHQLKGADLQLYRAARAYCLNVQIVPVASLDEWTEHDSLGASWPWLQEPLSPSKLAVVRSFTDDPTGGQMFEYEYHESWAKFLQEAIATHCPPRINSELLWITQPGKQHLKYCGHAIEFAGNEGPTTCFYAAAALLLVEVPPVGAPERQG